LPFPPVLTRLTSLSHLVPSAYDTNAELTGIAAADIIFDMLSVLTLGASDRRAVALEALGQKEEEFELESSHDEL